MDNNLKKRTVNLTQETTEAEIEEDSSLFADEKPD